MRHKYIILALLILLIVLVILKVKEPTKYPLSINYVWGKETKLERLSNKFLEDRQEASENAVKWDSFQIGNTKELVKSKATFTTDTSVVLGGKTFPCKTTFFYDLDGRLIEVHMSFTSFGLSIKNVTEQVLKLYGDHYLKVYNYNNELRRNVEERYFWLYGKMLIFYEDDCITDDGYLCVADASGLTNEQLKKYFRLGHVNGRQPQEPHIVSFFDRDSNFSYSTPSTSSLRTYKYGDSDTYQGSSQQKADIEAIDNYFGF